MDPCNLWLLPLLMGVLLIGMSTLSWLTLAFSHASATLVPGSALWSSSVQWHLLSCLLFFALCCMGLSLWRFPLASLMMSVLMLGALWVCTLTWSPSFSVYDLGINIRLSDCAALYDYRSVLEHFPVRPLPELPFSWTRYLIGAPQGLVLAETCVASLSEEFVLSLGFTRVYWGRIAAALLIVAFGIWRTRVSLPCFGAAVCLLYGLWLPYLLCSLGGWCFASSGWAEIEAAKGIKIGGNYPTTKWGRFLRILELDALERRQSSTFDVIGFGPDHFLTPVEGEGSAKSRFYSASTNDYVVVEDVVVSGLSRTFFAVDSGKSVTARIARAVENASVSTKTKFNKCVLYDLCVVLCYDQVQHLMRLMTRSHDQAYSRLIFEVYSSALWGGLSEQAFITMLAAARVTDYDRCQTPAPSYDINS